MFEVLVGRRLEEVSMCKSQKFEKTDLSIKTLEASTSSGILLIMMGNRESQIKYV